MATQPTYDTVDRPYNSNMQRSVFSEYAINAPGTTQEEGGRTIKSGEALTDVWIDTWLKSRSYQPKKQGFLIDSKGGYIECMNFAIGTGIEMYGNDAYYYDFTVALGGTYVATETSSLNFPRYKYPDQLFTMQKRVGYQSPSEDDSDNVFEMFYPNPEQSGRRNYIFFGGRGNTQTTADEHTHVIRIHSKQLFQIGNDVYYPKKIPDITVQTGLAPDAVGQAADSTRMFFTIKDTTATKYYDPTITNPSLWTAGAIVFSLYDQRLPYPHVDNRLVIDGKNLWLGGDFLPMAKDVLSLGSAQYRFLEVATQYLTFDAGHALSYNGAWVFGGGGSISCQGDGIFAGNGIFYGGVVQVGSTYFTPKTITYDDGGVTKVGTFLMA